MCWPRPAAPAPADLGHGACKEADTAAQAALDVVLADWLFTTPAGLVRPASGLWLRAAHVLYLLATLR